MHEEIVFTNFLYLTSFLIKNKLNNAIDNKIITIEFRLKKYIEKYDNFNIF